MYIQCFYSFWPCSHFTSPKIMTNPKDPISYSKQLKDLAQEHTYHHPSATRICTFFQWHDLWLYFHSCCIFVDTNCQCQLCHVLAHISKSPTIMSEHIQAREHLVVNVSSSPSIFHVPHIWHIHKTHHTGNHLLTIDLFHEHRRQQNFQLLQ